MKQLRESITCVLALSVLTGIMYPAIVWGASRLLFPYEAEGSLIRRDGRVLGSALIGQNFSEPRYFWSRPSATTPVPYNAASSSGSNLALTNPQLNENVRARVEALRNVGLNKQLPISVDLVTSSASGLDPDISLAGALYQVPRVAKLRGLSEESVAKLVQEGTKHRILGLFGEERVNVLELNLALDRVSAE